ncbi:hypothetical protein T02_6819 [Trichinella nativa]|uniref:Uncharacterized protein n=1 Tax=Trichinella nativa TaxID=6335 RepID=A0A0V1LR93_9BILA|nr:hypothetical protein T02_6819 [Trichinella nativa]
MKNVEAQFSSILNVLQLGSSNQQARVMKKKQHVWHQCQWGMHCTFSICTKPESNFTTARCIKYHNVVHLQYKTDANTSKCSRNESAPKVCTK